jgi:hypothetical protein
MVLTPKCFLIGASLFEDIMDILLNPAFMCALCIGIFITGFVLVALLFKELA